MKFIEDLNIQGKRILLRADLNVPLKPDGTISDDHRIRQFLPTLDYIINQKGKAVIISHLGRPRGKDPALSLRPIASYIENLIQKPVQFVESCVGSETKSAVEKADDNTVIILENLRFQPGEDSNDPEFAKELATFGDIYINDAFASAHRNHASVVGVAGLFQEKAAGKLMQKEMEYYERALIKPERPLCVILGGKKVSTKLDALMNIADRADKLLIGGAMANTFLAAQGLQMARSLYEPQLFPKALEILGKLARRDCKLYLPVDVIVGPSPKAKGLGRAFPVQEIPADAMALDIGPATSILFKQALHTAETIIWCGPMGAFENEDYATGTFDMIEHLSNAHGLTVVGGGDTDAAIHQMELEHKFDYISTGGGAFLTLLEGQTLPAIQALEN